MARIISKDAIALACACPRATVDDVLKHDDVAKRAGLIQLVFDAEKKIAELTKRVKHLEAAARKRRKV